ncbi:MAG TPA: Flp pilus assembly protein CpaB [Planctomycetaceae bacterium]
MKMKSMVLLLVAAGFGLVAMLGVMQVLKGGAKEPTVQVLVAKAAIPSGMPLDDTNVEFKEMPQKHVPSGAVTKKEEIEGKCLITPAVPGEILMSAKLGGEEAITASHQIPKGMRVATVSVNATKSHSGLIRPTDRVDVVCMYETYNPAARSKSKRVKTVLEYIEVFAVDNVRAGREGEVDVAVKNVSLLVDPAQYQLLKAAEQMGDLDLSLRNREDTAKTDVAEVTDALFTQQDTSEGSREAPERPTPAARPAATDQGGGLQDFLASAMTAMASAATVPAAAAESPTWTMTICRGPSIEDVEVLDESALPKNLTAAERQRIRAESRGTSPAQDSRPAPAKETPAAPAAPPALTPIPEPAAAAPPAAPEPAAQTAAAAAAPPALLPLLPFEN